MKARLSRPRGLGVRQEAQHNRSEPSTSTHGHLQSCMYLYKHIHTHHVCMSVRYAYIYTHGFVYLCMFVAINKRINPTKEICIYASYKCMHEYVCSFLYICICIYGHALRGPPPPPPSMVYGPGCPPSCGMECGFPLPPVGWLWGFWGFGSSLSF